MTLRVSPRGPLKPDVLIYQVYFLSLFFFQCIKVFNFLKSTNKNNYLYYYSTHFFVLAVAQIKVSLKELRFCTRTFVKLEGHIVTGQMQMALN